MKIIASAPGNLFLFGEHASVYGYPAILTSIDRRTIVEMKDISENKISIFSQLGTINAQIIDGKLVNEVLSNPELEIVYMFVKQTIENFSIKCGFEINIKSEIPVGSGMSSSTAVLCSLFGAMTEFAGKPVNPEDYFDYIFPFQRQIHGGSASGNEIISSAIGGMNYIKKEDDKIKKVQFSNAKLNVVVADSRVKSPTKLTVAYHVPSMIKRRKEETFGRFDEIERIVDEAVILLSKNNLSQIEERQIGNLINLNQDVLDKLYLSHPKLDDCINEARLAGAYGAKLSGSGWGGIMFALVTPENELEVKSALEATGARVIVSKIGVEGIKIEKNG